MSGLEELAFKTQWTFHKKCYPQHRQQIWPLLSFTAKKLWRELHLTYWHD